MSVVTLILPSEVNSLGILGDPGLPVQLGILDFQRQRAWHAWFDIPYAKLGDSRVESSLPLVARTTHTFELISAVGHICYVCQDVQWESIPIWSTKPPCYVYIF